MDSGRASNESFLGALYPNMERELPAPWLNGAFFLSLLASKKENDREHGNVTRQEK
jgi:hypothetical protein